VDVRSIAIASDVRATVDRRRQQYLGRMVIPLLIRRVDTVARDVCVSLSLPILCVLLLAASPIWLEVVLNVYAHQLLENASGRP